MISRPERGVDTFELNLPTRLLCSVCGLRISGCVPRDRGVSSAKLKDHRDIFACWFGRLNFDEAGFVRSSIPVKSTLASLLATMCSTSVKPPLLAGAQREIVFQPVPLEHRH